MATPVTIRDIPVFPHGPQPAPVMIADPVRGSVLLASAPDEPFCGVFDMLPGQIRGRAWHQKGTAAFHLYSGSYVSITSDPSGQNAQVHRLTAPKTVIVPAGNSHTFIPLTSGIIVETADQPTSVWLGKDNFIKIPELLNPLIDRILADIAAGKYPVLG